jgi:hypothetical protein
MIRAMPLVEDPIDERQWTCKPCTVRVQSLRVVRCSCAVIE